MHILLTCAYTAIFIYIIRKWSFFRSEGIPSSWPSILFLLKIAAGVFLGLIYTYHYTDTKTTDTFKFFNDSSILFGALRDHPYDFFRMLTGYHDDAPELRKYYLQMDAWLNTNMLFNDNRTIIRLNAVFHFFSLGNYYVHVVLLNFLSMTGLFALYKVFSNECGDRKKELLLLTFMLPSTLFWGSGLLKDGLLIFGMGIFIYHFYYFLKSPGETKRLLPLIVMTGLLSITKFYIIIILAPGLVTWWITARMNLKHSGRYLALVYAVFFIVAFNFYRIVPEYDLAAMLYWKQFNFYGFANSVDSKSLISIPILGLDSWSVIKNIPHAFVTTFFRPFFFDIKGNPLVLLSVTENCILFVITGMAIYNFRKPLQKDKGLFWTAVCFILILYVLIGLTTPVLGAIVRYKIPALPFLGFVLISLSKKPKFIINIEQRIEMK